MKTNVLLLIVVLMSGPIAVAQPATTSPTPSTAAANQLAAEPPLSSQTQSIPAKPWAGDIRLRFRDQKNGLSDPRIFEVLRARLGYHADIQDDMTAYLRLATATSAVSANQTLGDTQGSTSGAGMQRRSFGLDLAYLEYRPMAGTQGWLGKTPNPFYSAAKNQLVFDADINFEGVSAKWARDVGDLNYFANIGSSIVSENFASPTDSPDLGLLGAQVGVGYKLFGSWTVAAGYYTWDNAQGRTANQIAGGTAPAANGRYFGNTFDASAVLASQFNIIDAAIDWQKKFGDLTTEVFYDFGRNSDAILGQASYEKVVGWVRQRLQGGRFATWRLHRLRHEWWRDRQRR
jgi:hypothetical protein